MLFTLSYSFAHQQLSPEAQWRLGRPEPAGNPIVEMELLALLQKTGLGLLRRHRVLPVISEVVAVVANAGVEESVSEHS